MLPRVSIRAQFAGFVTLLVAVAASSTGPLVAPAAADSSTLCRGYAACATLGMSASGYAQNSSTMYWRMYSGHNCTNYAAYRMVRSGLPNVRPWSGGGNATYWGTSMSQITDSTPRVGAVAWWKAGVWPAGSAGHVAYVEQVVSATEIIVSQDSWGGDFSWARITKSGRGWPSGFVHFNDVPLTYSVAPVISGTAKVGTPLTVTPGSWSQSGVTLSYQWKANGTSIAGATSTTFTPTPDLEGKVVAVQVSAAKLGFPTTSATTAATAAVLPGRLVNTVAPSVSGDPTVDATLTASPGSWTPEPARVNLQWFVDGVAVPGATASTLAVGPELVGKSVTVRAAARRPGYDVVRRRAAVVGPVAPGTLDTVREPSVVGTPQPEQSLSLTPPTVTPQAAATIEWLRDGVVVPEASGATYKMGLADLGSRIRARTSFSRPGYTPLTVVTPATARVRAPATISLTVVPRRARMRVVATVHADGVVPNGTARVWSRGKLLASVPVVDGRAGVLVGDLQPGPRTVRVRFLGSTTVLPVGALTTVTIP